MEHTRREFLQALGFLPFAAAATAATVSEKPIATPAPTATPAAAPEDPFKALKEFDVPDGIEPVTAFAASRGAS